MIAVAGCQGDPNKFAAPEAQADATKSPSVKKAADFRPSSVAGVPIKEPPAGGVVWAQLVAGRSFSQRPDPFALQSKERSFEVGQTAERLFSADGWRTDFVPRDETPVIPEIEPQPLRRLAGVIVGDSVLALIDMGDGQLQLIRPGQEIQGWRVVSIDGDKAVLRRSGNKLPREIVVLLQEPLNGGGGVGTGNNPNGPGGRGRPGAPGSGLPPGVPGGNPSGLGAPGGGIRNPGG